jgi:hypothetical protein
MGTDARQLRDPRRPLIAASSLIEFKLECMIWHLIGGHPRDLRRLTARLDVRPKQESIDELIASRANTRTAQGLEPSQRLAQNAKWRPKLACPWCVGASAVRSYRRAIDR